MTSPIHESWPDDVFPVMSGLGHRPLIELPQTGAGVLQQCTACGREVWFNGRDLCRLFPVWLTRDVWAWAAAMTCDDCPSPRQRFSARKDLSADQPRSGSNDSVDAQQIRRLAAWLPEGGLRLDDVAYLLRGVDATKIREAGFGEDIVLLFTSPYHSDHYRPTRRSSEPAAKTASNS